MITLAIGEVWPAVGLALVVSVIGPFLLSWLTGKQRAAEKLEDYKRQDDVAQKLYERGEKTAQRVRETADALLKDNEKVAHVAAETRVITLGKLEQIHTLVNSNMTAALQAELDATARERAMMTEVIELKKAQRGAKPTDEAVAAMTSADNRIKELTKTLADRLEQSKLAEKQVEASEKSAATI